jgi:sulfite exporter TauE/SafE
MPIDLIALGAAFLAGLLGSVHCVAMCGGIATGFAVPGAAPATAWRIALVSNVGRVTGYMLAGAIVGGLGHGLVALFRMPNLAIVLRAAAGVVMIVVALRLLGHRLPDRLGGLGETLWRWLKPLQGFLLPANTLPKRFALGMLWGWLPCGLSGTMLAAAWMQASTLGGFTLMAAFGCGTLPAMLPLSYSGARWLARPGQRRIAGFILLIAGLITVAMPWLMQVPALHGVLAALGCLPRA